MNEINKDVKEKVIQEHDKMGLVQALTILHHFRDLQRTLGMQSELADALDVIFEWIDNAVVLFHKLGSNFRSKENESKEESV